MRQRAIALLPVNRERLTAPPADRGPVLEASEIAERFFFGKVSTKWVLAHCAPNAKFYLGRIAAWYEADVLAWLPKWEEQQRRRGKLQRAAAEVSR